MSTFKLSEHNKSVHLIWALLFFISISFSFFLIHANIIGGCISITALYLIYFFFSDEKSIKTYKWVFFAIILISLQTISMSIFTSRSLVVANQIAACFFLFCSLLSINDDKNKIINQCLIFFALLQASALIQQYLLTQARSTGLLLDYSQASFFILIAFLLSLKESQGSRLWQLYVLILFTAIFTAFSRTTNFLIIFLLPLLAFYSYRTKTCIAKPTTLITIGLAFLLVHFYPMLFGSETIDRGGLRDLSNLNSRVYYWEAAINGIKQSPLWGSGLINFEYLGIKADIPTSLVTFAHNDYLDLWVSLGIFWLIVFIVSLTYILIKHSPITLKLQLKHTDSSRYIAWSLLLSISLYMIINFLIQTLIFQILIAIILSRILRND